MHHQVLFMERIKKFLLKKQILSIILFRYMLLPRNLMNSWHIHTVIYMIFQQQGYVFLQFTDQWDVQIWRIMDLRIIFLQVNRLRFLTMEILKMIYTVISPTLTILLKEWNVL